MVIFPILLLAVVSVFVISFPIQFSEASDYEPLSIISLDELPTVTEFLNNDQESFLPNTIHSTLIRDNGEKVELYFLISDNEFVGVFYFEDETDEVFTENPYYETDLFVMNVRPAIDAETTYAVALHRNNDSCVKSITSGEEFDYSVQDDCNKGIVTTKQTSEGWATYVKFFVDFDKPFPDKPYYLKWAYIDAAQLDDNGRDQSDVYLWPEQFFFGWHCISVHR